MTMPELYKDEKTLRFFTMTVPKTAKLTAFYYLKSGNNEALLIFMFVMYFKI